MSFYTLAKSLTGRVAGTPLTLAQEAVAEALGQIYDNTDWSFQRAITYGGWLCPGTVANVGTYTTTPYSNQVVADAVATAKLASLTGQPLITTLQFRNPAYSIYNIVGYDTTTNSPFATLTLDRPWMEPTQGSGQPYLIYQCYFVAPVQDFRKFIEIRDTTNSAPVDFTSMTEAELSLRDPQRTQFADPAYVVPAGVDMRSGTSTPGWQMFELWPQQLSYIPYSFSFRRRGIIPQTYNDFVAMSPPYPITEEFVKWRALEVLYQWKESQKEKDDARGSGANFLLLAQMAQKEYDKLYSTILSIDLNLNGEAFTRIAGRRGNRRMGSTPYSNQLGGLNLGGFPGRY